MFNTLKPTRPSRSARPAVHAFVVCGAIAISSVPLPGRGLSFAQASAPSTPGAVVAEQPRAQPDFVQPAPLLESDWTPKATGALSLGSLEYVVTNASAASMTLTATLLWDAGTTEGRTTVVDQFVVPARKQLVRRIDPARIPTLVKGERYPGLIQVSLESSEGETVVLPAFFVMPRRTDAFPPAAAWQFELMDAGRLEAATREVSLPDQEGGAAVRVVEWRPSSPAPPQ